MYDVIVIGAGPAGSSTAWRLARIGARVALLERHQFPRPKPCGGGLPPKTCRLVGDIIPLESLRGRSISGSYLCCDAEDLVYAGLETAGLSVERSGFDLTLLEAAAAAGSDVLMPVAATGLEESADRVAVSIDAGRTVAGRFAVLAEGATGTLRPQLGLPGCSSRTIVLQVEVLPRELPAAFRESTLFDFGFIPEGYAWVFPKSDHLNLGVYRPFPPGVASTDGALLKDFVRRFEWGRDAELGPVRGHPLPCDTEYSRYHTRRTLLVGDAAGTVESFLGEGLFYGLRSGCLAAAALEGVLAGTGSLDAYTRRFRSEILPQLRASRTLSRFFYRRQRFGYHRMTRNRMMNRLYARMIQGSVSPKRCCCATFAGLPFSILSGNLPARELAEVGLARG